MGTRFDVVKKWLMLLEDTIMDWMHISRCVCCLIRSAVGRFQQPFYLATATRAEHDFVCTIFWKVDRIPVLLSIIVDLSRDQGDQYSGNWHQDKKHGYGKYIWSDGGKLLACRLCRIL